ncbi:hypothetical protein HPB50_018351 [Hyalomma asiaticum]|uniref:Uncharacterized protein n=1 Tax=Hyalomma asiaticum TaxID=266040 RepID=A0ACB7RJW8_HYAAI|nr:hypothetical protein HPB50_018351 [Hyalomma asiaticum]
MASSASFALASLAFHLFLLVPGQRVGSATEGASAADGRGKEIGSSCVPRPGGDTIGERSTCPFTVIVDKNYCRFPPIIYHFSCHCPMTRCRELDDYRCVQVKKPLKVSIQGWNATARTTTVVPVNASCVCAAAKSKRIISQASTTAKARICGKLCCLVEARSAPKAKAYHRKTFEVSGPAVSWKQAADIHASSGQKAFVETDHKGHVVTNADNYSLHCALWSPGDLHNREPGRHFQQQCEDLRAQADRSISGSQVHLHVHGEGRHRLTPGSQDARTLHLQLSLQPV